MVSPRQKIMKLIYPLILFFKKRSDVKGKILENFENKKSIVPFHGLRAIANNGKEVSMNDYKGKKIIVVNVASNCGFTGQYDELEKLYQENKDKLVVLGFPANDFRDQEPGSDKEIEQFCRMNYGVTFPLFKKQSVLSPNQEEVFQWLTNERQNGWNKQEPVWNFCKYIIDETGMLKGFYGSAVSPLGKEITEVLK